MSRAESGGMDLGEASIALRERPLLDVLDLALRFIVKHAAAYAVTAMIVLPPCAIATFAVGELVGWWPAWLLAVPMSLVAQAPFTALAGRLVFEPSARARDALGDSIAALPRLLLARTIQVAGIVLGSLLLMLPGVWLAVRFFFVGEVIVLERARAGAAISRAQRIIGGFSGDAMVALFVLLMLHVFSLFLADVGGREAIEDLLEFSPPDPVWAHGGSVLAVLGFWAFVPFAATSKLLVYLNVRTRTEGWDVQARFLALVHRAKTREALA